MYLLILIIVILIMLCFCVNPNNTEQYNDFGNEHDGEEIYKHDGHNISNKDNKKEQADCDDNDDNDNNNNDNDNDDDNDDNDNKSDKNNMCEEVHGEYIYKKCLMEDGGNDCKYCDYCICVAKSGDASRCQSDKLFRECINQNIDLNNYEASKNCGLVKNGTPCKCKSCLTDEETSLDNLFCSTKDKCSINDNICYYQPPDGSKSTNGNISCNCDEGLLENPMDPLLNRQCTCIMPKPPIYPPKPVPKKIYPPILPIIIPPIPPIKCKKQEKPIDCKCNLKINHYPSSLSPYKPSSRTNTIPLAPIKLTKMKTIKKTGPIPDKKINYYQQPKYDNEPIRKGSLSNTSNVDIYKPQRDRPNKIIKCNN